MRRSGLNTFAQRVPDNYKNKGNVSGFSNFEGLYIGKVIEIVDDRYEGYCYVEIIGQQQLSSTTGNPEDRKN